jgi:predicted Zn-dependent protease
MENDALSKILSFFKSKGFQKVEVFYESKYKVTLQTAKEKEGRTKSQTFFEQGIGVNLIKSDHSDLTTHRFYSGSPFEVLERLNSNSEQSSFLFSTSKATQEVPIQECSGVYKLEELEQIHDDIQEMKEEAVATYGNVLQGFDVHIKTIATEQRMTVVDSSGTSISDHRYFITTDMWSEFNMKGKPILIHRSMGGEQVTDILKENQHRILFRDLVATSAQMDRAIDVPEGEMPVVFGPGNPASLIHEACGHGLEADIALQEKSVYSKYINKQISTEQLTIVDDPLFRGAPGSYKVDDEGVVAESTILISKGKLINYLYNKQMAMSHGKQSNGHARRVSYRYPSLPRMSNTFVSNGEYTPEEIIRQTKKGIYVRSVGAGETDLMTGRFKVRLAEGYLIENGQLTTPLKTGWIVGTGPEVLKSIDRVGNDFKMYDSAFDNCNKWDQMGLTVSVGSPTLRVKNIQIMKG